MPQPYPRSQTPEKRIGQLNSRVDRGRQLPLREPRFTCSPSFAAPCLLLFAHGRGRRVARCNVRVCTRTSFFPFGKVTFRSIFERSNNAKLTFATPRVVQPRAVRD